MSCRRKVIMAMCIVACIMTICIIVSSVLPTVPYPDMHRISSQSIHGSKTTGDHSIELPGLKKGQLVVIEAADGSGVFGSWIKHSSLETYVLESQGLTNGKLEYEVSEDADYTFQLNCEHGVFDVSISVWEKK